MSEITTTSSEQILFIADAHLGKPGDNPARAENLAKFLRQIRGHITHLYIVGDLFDFWFEYRTVVPSIAPHVIFELYNLIQSGTKVIFFAGNHDYWAGNYLAQEVMLDIERNGRTVEHQGRRIFIHHGDGFYPSDHGYRFLKRILRNPFSIFLFRLLHPDFASWIARVTSKTSRNYLTPKDFEEINRNTFRKIADDRLGTDCDAVVYGHAHIPLVEARPHGTLVILGDWITHSTYVLLKHGEFTIHSWDPTTPLAF
jgi:UDP-2,3-diacylglucosamine hydrolase